MSEKCDVRRNASSPPSTAACACAAIGTALPAANAGKQTTRRLHRRSGGSHIAVSSQQRLTWPRFMYCSKAASVCPVQVFTSAVLALECLMVSSLCPSFGILLLLLFNVLIRQFCVLQAAESKKEEFRKYLEGSLQMKDIIIKQLTESIEEKNAYIECLEITVRLLYERLQRELKERLQRELMTSGAPRP